MFCVWINLTPNMFETVESLIEKTNQRKLIDRLKKKNRL